MKRTCLFCLFGLFVLFRTAFVRAEPRARVAVVLSGGQEAREQLEKGLAQQKELPVDLRLSPLPNAPSEAVEEDVALQSKLQEARARYIEADFERCLAQLPDDAALTGVLGRGDTLLAARTLLWRTACEQGRGGAAAAARAATSFAIMGFEMPADVGAISPEAERLLTDALRALQRATRVQINLESGTAAEVSVDGRPAGCVTPCTLQLVAGDHVFALHADGYAAHVERSNVSGANRKIAFTLEAASPELARKQWSARHVAGGEIDQPSSLRLLSIAVPAQKLVLIEATPAREGKLELRGAYAIDGRVAARAGSEPMKLAKLPDEGLSLVRELLVRGNTLEPPRPLWKNPWLWVAVGVGAAAAATATALLLQKPDQRTEIKFQ